MQVENDSNANANANDCCCLGNNWNNETGKPTLELNIVEAAYGACWHIVACTNCSATALEVATQFEGIVVWLGNVVVDCSDTVVDRYWSIVATVFVVACIATTWIVVGVVK